MYRLKYHLEPSSGWMNDPNGLVWKNGIYHIYYQYSKEPEGGLKYWKQFTTKDFLHYQDEGIALSPDHPHDAGGAYSGCCFNDSGKLRYYYTGNVKLPGNYDYINEGREHNVMYVESQDGLTLENKEVLLYNKDYPDNMSCHVRDPYVYENDGTYYMVLGARTLDSQGHVMLYRSDDLKKWSYVKTVSYKEPFGYMWECPNYLQFKDKNYLFCCPQGLETKDYDYEAIYQNGYFPLSNDLEKDCVLEDFIEFDHGFDIYAQQFFKDNSGRMIMAGWMGLPDIDYKNPTVKEGRQHAFTLFREITEHNGRLYQYPIEEYKALRENKKEIHSTILPLKQSSFECHLSNLPLNFKLTLRDVEMNYEDGLFTIDMTASGEGRGEKHIKIPHLDNITIFSDTSSLELFFNDGAYAFTTRIYDDFKESDLVCDHDIDMVYYNLKAIQVEPAK